MTDQPKTKKLKMNNDEFVVTWPHSLRSKTFQPVCQYQPLPPWAEYDTSPTESPSHFESIVSDGQAKFKRVLEEPVIAAVIQLTEATLYELECSFTAVNDDKQNIETFLDQPSDSNNLKKQQLAYYKSKCEHLEQTSYILENAMDELSEEREEYRAQYLSRFGKTAPILTKKQKEEKNKGLSQDEQDWIQTRYKLDPRVNVIVRELLDYRADYFYATLSCNWDTESERNKWVTIKEEELFKRIHLIPDVGL